MKKIFAVVVACLSVATVAWVQITAPAPRPLAELTPGGALIYVEAKDFHSLLSEWNQSGVKQAWLASANYQVFTNSNLLQKLQGLYQEYGGVAGFLPGLPGTLEIAGRESSLALYDLREQHFVYITRIAESELTKSQLWRLREKFGERQASGATFYMKRDDASHRTVAFAFTRGYLVLATRDDLMARTLALIAGGRDGNLSSEPWFADARAQAGAPGELRMALNLQQLFDNVSFRSYWIQRNASELRPFRAEIADVKRTQNRIEENRVFVRLPEQTIAPPSADALQSVAALRALTSAQGVLARAWASPSADQIATLIESKLLAPASLERYGNQYAPPEVSTDEAAGSEQDLETRIDEAPLPTDVSGGLNAAALRNLVAQAAPNAMLHIQSSAATERFVHTPSVIVLATAGDWDAARVREALSMTVETLWTTARLGVGWRQGSAGSHMVEQLDGLAPLQFSIQGGMLFIANDAGLLAGVLDRVGSAPVAVGASYAAEFHHAAARQDYMRIMQALDFGARSQSFFFNPQGDRTPPFFSGNLASLSDVFRFVQSVAITHVDLPTAQRQTVVYQ